jgi:hypothetical protein
MFAHKLLHSWLFDEYNEIITEETKGNNYSKYHTVFNSIQFNLYWSFKPLLFKVVNRDTHIIHALTSTQYSNFNIVIVRFDCQRCIIWQCQVEGNSVLHKNT